MLQLHLYKMNLILYMHTSFDLKVFFVLQI